MGRRNTQVEPNLRWKQKLDRLLRLEQPENYSGWALIEYNQTEEVLKESIVESSY
jgi:hypothetical protein